jgi:hypothetical protein
MYVRFKNVELNMLFDCSIGVDEFVFIFSDPNGALPQTPVTFCLDAKSNQKNQEIPEAISCADQKTKAKKCPRLPLFLTPLSSFAGGNFGED